MDDKKRRITAFIRLAETLGATLSETRLVGVLDATAHIHIDKLEWACREGGKRFEFFPAPVKIIELAGMAPALKVASARNQERLPEMIVPREEAIRRVAELRKQLGVKLDINSAIFKGGAE